jgi:DNA polymerase III alpha subunit
MMASFVHLQVCSACAYLAASSPEALVAQAVTHGMTTLALPQSPR